MATAGAAFERPGMGLGVARTASGRAPGAPCRIFVYSGVRDGSAGPMAPSKSA
jgi:hypothetical protein